MRKIFGPITFGMGLGATLMFLAYQYKGSEITKAVNNGTKEIAKAVNKIKDIQSFLFFKTFVF